MELVICPNCSQEQIKNKEDFCSFCFTPFNNKEKTEPGSRPASALGSKQNKTLKKLVYWENPDNIRFILYPMIFAGFFSIAFFCISIIGDTFPWKFSFFSLLSAVLGAVFFYQKLYGEAVTMNIALKRKKDVQHSVFWALIITNFMFLLNLFFIADASLSIYPDREHKGVIHQKWMYSGKGTSYQVSVSSWRKDSYQSVNLSINSHLWHQLQPGDLLYIKIKKGGLGIEKIKTMKQVYR